VADDGVIENPWASLRTITNARIALGRAGVSQPTRHHLAFQLAHARARDAVHSALDVPRLAADLQNAGFETIELASAAVDRATYLQRPDLGRRLSDASVAQLPQRASGSFGCGFVVADGLTSIAAQRHALPLLGEVVELLDITQWTLAPVAIVEQGRVAIGDEIGQRLGADLVVVLIGERPGLSSPDSLGIYLTWEPRVGRADAERNCISNIHSGGLGYGEAARTLVYLMTEARRRRLSGVLLKDESRLPGLGNRDSS
jgi:ethanolamine ammonia-lyase small subunit